MGKFRRQRDFPYVPFQMRGPVAARTEIIGVTVWQQVGLAIQAKGVGGNSDYAASAGINKLQGCLDWPWIQTYIPSSTTHPDAHCCLLDEGRPERVVSIDDLHFDISITVAWMSQSCTRICEFEDAPDRLRRRLRSPVSLKEAKQDNRKTTRKIAS